MKITQVVTQQDAVDFLQVPVRLYAGHPHWIRPLDNDINLVFDERKNHAFRQGECCRWLLRNEQGHAIGRVAAFVHRKTVHQGNDQPTGGMGFFECPDDRQAAFMLFDTCKEWLTERGMEAMDGSINFGNRDKWWGVLVDGFDKDPNYQANYNLPYYKDLFESYGFQVYFEQYTFARAVMRSLSDKLTRKANLLAQDKDYAFRYLKGKELGRLPEYITTVYNKAWASRAGEKALSQRQSELIVKQMKPILDPELIHFGFYKGDPVSFFISIPEVNQVFKYVNGKLNWRGKLIFLWHTMLKKNRKALGVLFGITPEHQGKGLDGAMVMRATEVFQSKNRRYDDYEMSWIGDFNPRMIIVIKQIGAHISKTHYTYRKLFDESKPFKRFPIRH